MDRLLIALLAAVFGFVLGLMTPSFLSQVDTASAPQIFPTVTARATDIPLVLPRPSTPVPPPPTLGPAPTPGPTPQTARTWTIALAGGGEMKVVASDREAAINNVKSTGAIPAD